jgi:hypothetical protein
MFRFFDDNGNLNIKSFALAFPLLAPGSLYLATVINDFHEIDGVWFLLASLLISGALTIFVFIGFMAAVLIALLFRIITANEILDKLFSDTKKIFNQNFPIAFAAILLWESIYFFGLWEVPPSYKDYLLVLSLYALGGGVGTGLAFGVFGSVIESGGKVSILKAGPAILVGLSLIIAIGFLYKLLV